MTETESAPETHPELRAWLRTGADRFERWAREGGRAARWDFAPESLDALEVLVRQRFSGPEEIAAARSGEFVRGAVWYVGEVIRRAFPDARRRYDPFTSEGRSPARTIRTRGHFFVRSLTPDHDRTGGEVALD
ncbi:hypothetical protein ABZT08_06695 [Streptomyces sp. NPDC005526]|uniref:hypothetical protein n=1 Tax=Streptomyces sp. NPDC005526 TaxID=3156885 RepID=UPI0033A45DFF